MASSTFLRGLSVSAVEIAVYRLARVSSHANRTVHKVIHRLHRFSQIAKRTSPWFNLR